MSAMPVEGDELTAIRAAEQAGNLTDRARLDLQVRRWRLIHKRLHATPLDPDPALPRAAQWREIAGDVAAAAAEPELNAWVAEQIAVAENLAAGVQDMRPRKKGQVHALLLEWVADRKHKAHAVLKWSRAAHDADETPHWKPTGGTMDRSKPRQAPSFSPAPDYRKPDKRY